MEPEVYVSTKEAAEIAGVNPKTIRRWITRGRLPAEKDANDNYRVKPEDVEAARDNPGQRPALKPIVRREEPAFDLTPLFTRLEELTRDNERLRQDNAAKDEQLRALAAGDHSPWFARLLFWRKEQTHVSPRNSAPPQETER